MTHSISGDEKCSDLTYDDDYRSYLIARSVPLSDYRFGRMLGKRVFASARSAAKRAVACLKIMHQAIVAAKMRRLYRELDLRGARHDRRIDTTMLGVDRPPVIRKEMPRAAKP
jgi:hypothetical protein